MNEARVPAPRRAHSRRWLVRARLAIYALLLALVGYHAWRYDLVRIPPGGCSPLRAFAPGTRLVVDRRAAPRTGDAVLYRAPEGTLLGRVVTPPEEVGEEVRRACASGREVWVVKERRECPGPDSDQLGPIPVDALAGRIAGTLPW